MLKSTKSIPLLTWPRGVWAMTACLCVIWAGSAAAATFTVSPSAVSNFYSGLLTLQISGLTNGEPVIIQQYLDLNANGTVDGGESLVDSFPIADGGASVIGGVTNINVPYDSNPAGGAITTTIIVGSSLDAIIGQHIFRLVSPSGNFPPQTSLLAITNAPLAQSVTGTVFNGASPVPFGIAVALAQPGDNFVAGVVADATGHYQLRLKPGTYALFPVLPGYYTDQSIAAFVTLTNGGSAGADLFLTNGSPGNTLSGQMTDATNGSTLGGVFLQLESENLFAITFTDSSGSYSAALSPSFWRARPESDGLARRAYLGPQNRLQVDLTAGSVAGVNFAFPKANAMFYGRITDAFSVPIAGVKFFAGNDGDQWNASGFSDADGRYAVAILASTNQWNSSAGTSDNPSLAGYIVSSGLGGTTLSAGQSVLQDFVAIRATAQITGCLRDNLGNPVSDVNVNAQAEIGGTSFNTSALTDEWGDYLLPAVSGTWSVYLNCCGNEGLDSHGLYDPVNNGHHVSIPPTNVVLNITVYPTGTPLLGEPTRYSPTQVGFTLSGSVGASYTVQASTNLSVSNWFNLFSLSLTSNVMPIQDNQATNQQRFYRAQKN